MKIKWVSISISKIIKYQPVYLYGVKEIIELVGWLKDRMSVCKEKH